MIRLYEIEWTDIAKDCRIISVSEAIVHLLTNDHLGYPHHPLDTIQSELIIDQQVIFEVLHNCKFTLIRIKDDSGSSNEEFSPLMNISTIFFENY